MVRNRRTGEINLRNGKVHYFLAIIYQILSGYQNKEGEIGRTCSTHEDEKLKILAATSKKGTTRKIGI
jgi:hypothetical protein